MMKRCVAGAAALVAAVAGLAAAGPAAASSGSWQQVYQVNRYGSFDEVAAVSQTDIWAAGDLWHRNLSTIYQPFIRHWDGGAWIPVTLPGHPRFDSSHVSASSADNVLVFGLAPGKAAGSVAYRYDGSHWHKIPVPADTDLQGGVTLGPDDVWAFGTSGSIFAPGAGESASVFHWNGTRWRGYSPDGGRFIPESISASSAGNVWLGGFVWVTRKQVRALAYRWTAAGWHNMGLPRAATDYPAISALSADNDWVGWATSAATRAVRWNGRRWLTQVIPAGVPADPTNIVPDGQGGYWFGDAVILAGRSWISIPAIEATGSFGDVVRIPGTESFLQPAAAQNLGARFARPTLYRYDL